MKTKRTAKILGWQVVMALLLTVTVGAFVYSAEPITGMATFTSKGCNGNQICDVITECTAQGSCTTKYDNCQSCGVTTKVCASGVVSAQNACSTSGSSPACIQSAVSCSGGNADPNTYKILTFNVFTKKNLVVNITPTSQSGLAGSTLNYKISLENKNPKTLTFLASAEVPAGWSINIPEEFSVGQQSRKDVVVRVTSNESASDNAYPILVSLFNPELNMFGNVQATYIVASRGAPGVSTTPRTGRGYPGQTVVFNVTVTNNDPKDFDASTISLKASTPAGFSAVFTPTSLKIAAGQSASARLDVTSPNNASEVSYPITVNATSNKVSGLDFIEYQVDLCGNSVCDLGEENSCFTDCPADENIICNGRCETQLDDGLRFDASVAVPFSKFIVCSRNSTQSTCNAAARTTNGCGIGKACLCNAAVATCNVRCVDTRGVYYVMVNGTAGAFRTVANYSYACPFVDLPDFKGMRADFAKAKQDYEKAQSALRETLKKANATLQEKSQGQPCVDALGIIIGNLDNFLKYLDRVIAWPGIINTTAARATAEDVRGDIDRLYNAHCQGASGLLQINSISAATAEKNTTADISVVVTNVGNTPYFGFVSCDLTGAAGEKSTVNTTCDVLQGTLAFNIPVQATSAGLWKARCRAFGSLISDCSVTTVHDDKTGNFSVFSKETFITDVTGVCTGTQVNCSVKTTRAGCGLCSIDGLPCTRTGSVNNTDTFVCDAFGPGVYQLTATVLNSNNCKPIEPSVKNITVRCAGCGDGTVDSGEQCELPFTDNNAKCIQQETTCQDRLFAVRDKLGFCGLSCACVFDEYELSCTRGKCGAECEDGETRAVTLNKTGGRCTCTQQCGSACGWNACDCEPGTNTTGPPTGVPTVQITHSPQTPTTGPLTLTATGTNATAIEIYVDGFLVRTCAAFPCSITTTYGAGVHSYFARASNAISVTFDPSAGSKSFTVPGAAASTTNVNVTGSVTTNGGTTTNTGGAIIITDGTTTTTGASGGTTTSTAGTTTVTGANTTIAGGTTVTTGGTTTITGGTVTTSGNTTTIAGGTVTTVGGTSTNTGGSTATTGGTATGPGGTVNGGTSTNTGGTTTIIGGTTRTTGGTTTITAGTVTTTGGTTTTTTGGTTTTTGVNTSSLIIDVSHSPSSATITTLTTVILSAVAYGPVGLKEVDIYIDGTLRKSCVNQVRSVPCTYRATFPQGTHNYFAAVLDVANSNVLDPATGTKSFDVTAAPPPSTGPTPGSIGGLGGTGGLNTSGSTGSTGSTGGTTTVGGVVVNTSGTPQGVVNTTRGRCYARIDAKSCTYNPATRRYDLFMSASWDNGTHAHWVIEDNTGPKVYSKRFNRTEPQAGPGLKTLRIEVHNENDTALCYASENIYCGPGTTTGKDVDIIIDTRNVVPTGSTLVRVIAVPYRDINPVNVYAYTDIKSNVSNARMQGNTSIAGLSGPARVALNGTSYSLLTVSALMQALKNVTLSYAASLPQPGEYKIVVYANYSGKSEMYAKTIKATNCPNTNSVLAQQGDNCKSFTTSCDVPQGWDVVDRCGEALEEPPQGETPTGAAIVVLVIIIILALAYKFRDQIREKFARQKEEMPSIQFEE